MPGSTRGDRLEDSFDCFIGSSSLCTATVKKILLLKRTKMLRKGKVNGSVLKKKHTRHAMYLPCQNWSLLSGSRGKYPVSVFQKLSPKIQKKKCLLLKIGTIS